MVGVVPLLVTASTISVVPMVIKFMERRQAEFGIQ
jgi:hypothetical protein